MLELVRAGRTYEEAGHELGVPPGQAYMIATGTPADASTEIGPEPGRRVEGLLDGSTQHLANPPTSVPERDGSVEEWMRRRASADAQMQRAAAARTAEPPPVQGEGRTTDIVSVVGWDHNQVKYLLAELEAVPGVRQGGRPDQLQQRFSIVDMVRVRLSAHETMEEEYLWPAVRRVLPDGDGLAGTALTQEQEGKDLLQAMAAMSPEQDRFDESVDRLALALRRHVAFEDMVLLRLYESMPDQEREDLGRNFLVGKSHAPTRPHPYAPGSPTADKVAAGPAAPLDKLADAAGDRQARDQGPAVPGLAGQTEAALPDDEDAG